MHVCMYVVVHHEIQTNGDTLIKTVFPSAQKGQNIHGGSFK